MICLVKYNNDKNKKMILGSIIQFTPNSPPETSELLNMNNSII